MGHIRGDSSTFTSAGEMRPVLSGAGDECIGKRQRLSRMPPAPDPSAPSSSAARLKAAIVGVIVLIATIVCSAVLHFRAMNALKFEVQDKLLRAARSIAAEVDAELHQTFTNVAQEASPEYARAIQPLEKARYWVEDGKLVRNDYRFIYTTILKDGQVFFILDPTPAGSRSATGVEEKSHIMQPAPDATDELRETLQTGKPTADPEPYSDQWGTFVSGYAAFFNSAGQVVGAVGVDWEATTYAHRLAGIRRAWYLQIALCLLSGFVSGVGAGIALVRRERVEAAQRHAIEEARRNRERWRIMVETLPKPAVHLQDGEVFINEPMERLLGYRHEEVRTLDQVFSLVFGERAVEVRAKYEADRAALFQQTRELRARCRDGSWRWVEFTAHFYDPGEVWILNDITEQKEYQANIIAAREAAEAAAQAKGAFLATVSHEIRTPMNGVIGMANLLLESPLELRQREMAETIRNCGESLVVVINDILDFSKIESGGMELETEPVDLRSCIEDCLELFSGKAAEKGLNLVYTMDPACPAIVRGDPTRLRQVLSNLIGNAVKFTPKGEIQVHFAVEGRRPDEGEAFTLAISVRDTGIGIPADRMDRLFKSFSQVDSSTARKYGGTGLGLAISKRLVELMGGTIGVTSAEGKGSTFRFTLRTRAEPASSRATSGPKASLVGVRALVVEENETLATVLQSYLRQWGLDSLAVSDATQALRALRDPEPYRLIITDLQLPGMDGFELCRRIKDTPAAAAKIVMISSVTRAEIRQEAKDLAISALLQKPIRPGTLLQTIEMLLSGAVPAPTPNTPPPFNGADFATKRPLRILVADDNEVNRLVAHRIFERFGYKIDAAVNGADAARMVQERQYDVVFMDINMPEMNGYEASRLIRETVAPEHQPWIVALTASALEGDREVCLQNGMNEFLTKPIRLPDLERTLKAIEPKRAV